MVKKMPKADRAQIAKTVFSIRVRHMWGLDLHGWETAMLISLGVAAIAAMAVVVATAVVVRLQHIETEDSQRELEAYKSEAAELIANANSEAAKANESTAKLNNETAKLQADNLALQTVLRPRHIGVTGALGGTSKVEALFATMAEFRDVSFAIQPVNDAEARNLANEIMLALAFVGIKSKIDEGATSVNPMTVAEGVMVLFPLGNTIAEKAGNALADALTGAGLGLGNMPVYRQGSAPPDPKDIAAGLVNPIHNGVVVAVGLRPVSQMVEWIKLRRSDAGWNPAQASTDK
jgi:F0F1-type ATP synthase epsilon subunit